MMFRFLNSIFNSGGQMVSEIKHYIAVMEQVPDDEMGVATVLAYHFANDYEQRGFTMMNPKLQMTANPESALFFIKEIHRAQNQGPVGEFIASGLMPWGHTMRLQYEPKLQMYVDVMWGHLLRGLEHKEKGLLVIGTVLDMPMKLDRFGEVPIGVTPLKAS